MRDLGDWSEGNLIQAKEGESFQPEYFPAPLSRTWAEGLSCAGSQQGHGKPLNCTGLTRGCCYLVAKPEGPDFHDDVGTICPPS